MHGTIQGLPEEQNSNAALNWRNRRNNLFLDYSGFLCTQIMPVESNNEKLIAVIGDEVGSEWVSIMEQDTVTGFLLAGIGDKSEKNGSNFMIVDKGTEVCLLSDFHRHKTKGH